MALCIGLFVASDLMAQTNGPGGEERGGRANGRKIVIKPRAKIDTSQCERLEFQTIDGTCNNISRTSRMEFGATDITMDRTLNPEYGESNPFHALGGEGRLSPREISNIVAQQESITFSATGLSALVFSWGQFIDHDITLTPEPEERQEAAYIELPADESLFTEPIVFFRSEFFNERGDGLPREQLNIVTAWIDASMVYGADDDRAKWLRTMVGGKLKTSRGDLLPFNTVDQEFESEIDPNAPSTAGGDLNTKMWVGGDVRAGEQAGLTALHVLFVREHNRICDELIIQGMVDDEEIYQTARRKVISLIQKITYLEFLPALGINMPAYVGYNERVTPNISNEFATAGYRLGHTMVVDSMALFDDACAELSEKPLSLVEAFFNPGVIQSYGLASILRGLAAATQYEVDPFIVAELRDFLFADPDASPVVAGLDLASLNIQRGRDHGLPDYNTIRAHYLGTPAASFDDISSNAMIVSNLREAYQNDIDEVDAWVGLLSENLVEGTSLGPTLHAMMIDQFSRIRDGDRFYYETYLSGEEKREIQNTTFSDIIMRNTSIEDLSGDVMFAEACGLATYVDRPDEFSSSIDVFPNPSNGRLRIIQEASRNQITSFLVTDVLGRTVVREQQFSSEVDLSVLPGGVYFIHFLSNGGRATKKVVLLD